MSPHDDHPSSAATLPALPVTAALPELGAALAGHGAAVLVAAPGSGKTTLVALHLLGAPWLGGDCILLLEPRRLAARAAAARMASLLGETVGGRVGFRVRQESRVGPTTRIEVVTEGILVRRLQRDPELAGVGLVILDEVHERHLETDLSLALLLDARRALRPELRVLLMSATLDDRRAAALLGGAPVVRAPAPGHPVEIDHAAPPPGEPLARSVARTTRALLAEHAGDVLVFLPGAREIRAAAEALAPLRAHGVAVRPLHGGLPPAEQDLALRPLDGPGRRVVLATNIAESSLTIEGVRAVVDSGLARVPRSDPRTGLDRLETVRISRASAAQRAGRAGRLGPGVCVRLWSAETHDRMLPFAPPEIAQGDLARLVLELAVWGVAEPTSLDWLDPPPEAAVAQARRVLTELGALEASGRVTGTGRALVELPAHPRLARMVHAARDLDAGWLACRLAALLEAPGATGGVVGRDQVDIVEHLRHAGPAVEQAARDLAARAAIRRAAAAPVDAGGLTGRLLALAFPDRVAARRPGGAPRFVLAAGRGVVLPESDPLASKPFLVVPSIDVASGPGSSGADGRARLAAVLDLDDLRTDHGARIVRRRNVTWDRREQAVIARDEERLGAIVLSSRELRAGADAELDPESVTSAMLEGIREMGLDVLPWTDAARGLQARVLSLREWRPDEGWPDLADATLADDPRRWLEPWLGGVSRRTHLARIDLSGILRAAVPAPLLARLDRLAPTHLTVPSGRRLRLEYRPGEPPALAVRLQELFGLAETPRICDGEVAVMLHLLSPANRPVQITRDLAGFWARTYADVRRELAGRYPRHAWPTDPMAATPTARARPR